MVNPKVWYSSESKQVKKCLRDILLTPNVYKITLDDGKCMKMWNMP